MNNINNSAISPLQSQFDVFFFFFLLKRIITRYSKLYKNMYNFIVNSLSLSIILLLLLANQGERTVDKLWTILRLDNILYLRD